MKGFIVAAMTTFAILSFEICAPFTDVSFGGV